VAFADGAILVGLGLAIGAFGTLIGAGGGFLLVPLLVLGYHFPPAHAVGTSLSLVFLNAASGSAAYLRQRRVDPAQHLGHFVRAPLAAPFPPAPPAVG